MMFMNFPSHLFGFNFIDRALSSGLTVNIHPSSVLFRMNPECIIFNELVRTNQNYIRNVSRIDYLWLAELAPQYFALPE